MTDRAPAPTDVEATLAAVIRRAQMVPYEDGEGGWLWRSASADEIAEALLASPALATLRAHDWDKGYTSGHSNAMRRMSDEPNAPTTPNPYRADRQEPRDA